MTKGKKIENEYVIWGKPPNQEQECVLYTKAETYQAAESIMQKLKTIHGCKDMRIQTIDFENPDMARMFREAINA